MDISALVNHDGDAAVPPRRSPSTSHSMSAPSPVSASAKLPQTPTATRRQMPLKRKRHDPKPIWAYREGEALPPELERLQEQRQPAHPTPQPPVAQHQSTPQMQAHPLPQAAPVAHRNGPPSNGTSAPIQAVATELVGYERPVSNDAHIYDDVSRKVCDFIWTHAINNQMLRNAVAESEHTELEVEARWGHIIDKASNSRLRGYHDTETVIKSSQLDSKFESTMTIEQHKRMNMYLNGQVRESKLSGAERAVVDYTHTREVDEFYELGQEQFAILPPTVKQLIHASGTRQRIRVTRDKTTNTILRSIIKHRIANLEISSPQTEWDYRIGINLEINYPGPIDNLQPVVEAGKSLESMKRQKDRMSYAWLGAYQVDLTQVQQGPMKNHELELELNANVLIENADKVRKKEVNSFEGLINGMMNNLRVLSREITPPAPGA